MNLKRVVVIGAGFGGLTVTKALRKQNIEILLFDKKNHHLFQPLLYQVATAALSPGNIAQPIRGILQNQNNTKVILAEIEDINRKEKKVITQNGQEYHYDWLVMASGSQHSYFGNPQWEKIAPGLKTLADAIHIREKILLSFEIAESLEPSPERTSYMTFVLVGAGPTGVEMAGAIAEIARKTLKGNFRNIDPAESRVILIEGSSRVLPPYSEKLSNKAKQSLEDLGVEVFTSYLVTEIKKGSIVAQKYGTQNKDDQIRIDTHNVIWAAGNEPRKITSKLLTETDRTGRAIVKEDLSLSDDPSIFVIGDAAAFKTKQGKFLPSIAPVAVQTGKFVAKQIINDLKNKPRGEFKYLDKGTMATIGRNHAVADIRGFKFSGWLAWLAWSIVHIFFLIGFRHRIIVFFEWIWYYLSYQRFVRLIVWSPKLPNLAKKGTKNTKKPSQKKTRSKTD